MQTKLEDFKGFKQVVESMIKPRVNVPVIQSPKRQRRFVLVRLPNIRESNQQSIEAGFLIMKRRLAKLKKKQRMSKEIARLKRDQTNYTGDYWKSVIVIE